MDLKFEIWREEREMFDELRRERERDDDVVRIKEKTTEPFRYKRGKRRGCLCVAGRNLKIDGSERVFLDPKIGFAICVGGRNLFRFCF